jgi:hypothetical protein
VVVSFIGGGNRSTHLERTQSQITDKLYQIMLYWVHLLLAGFKLINLVAIGTDCTSSYKSNYGHDHDGPSIYYKSHYCFVYFLQARLHVGLYSVYLKEWLKVFNKDQILVLRTEDYSANIKETMKTVFNFLRLGKYFRYYTNIFWQWR